MGRLALVALVTGAVTACARPALPGAGPDVHRSLACAECHRGGASDRTLGSVPPEACTGSGCHGEGVSAITMLASVPFDHRQHEGAEGVLVGCAGCHAHESGDAPLGDGAGTCGLCHADQLTGDEAADCRVCHASPSHEGLTSQGVAVPHEGLPWIEGGCLRCHFQVAKPVQQVDIGRCARCHEDVGGVAAAGVGRDLHPGHVGSACVACHEEDEHRIEAMSSSVDLVCAHCHTEEHSLALSSVDVRPEACGTCHREIHGQSQRLLLGIVPLGRAAAPSDHFMDGLTCRSCHADGASNRSPAGASGAACATCHRAEYATVLRWWQQGTRERITLVETYLAAAESATASREPDDPSRVAIGHARELVDLVSAGGGSHNLALTHRMLEQALADAVEAYEIEGRGAPGPPTLGRAPRQGLCSYCHYRLAEPGLSERMDDAFHREVLGSR